MKIGLVGYSGSGKSTVFQWLTGVTPDPGKVQQGQLGSTKVFDERLQKIADDIQPKKTTFAEVQFLDTPGLMVDERDSNPRRLAVIRESTGMAIVLDGFSQTNIAEQLAKFREELLYADLEVVMNRVPKVEAQLKKTKPAKEREVDEKELALLKRVVADFEAGKAARDMGLTEDEQKILRGFQLLTLKQEIALVNRGDSNFSEPLPDDLLALDPKALQAPVKFEMELADLDEESRAMFMADVGMTDYSKDRVVREMFYASGRVVFFTVGPDECRSWAMYKDSDAVIAAGCIHKQLGEKFVRANVIAYDDFAANDFSEKECKAKGLERTEGKSYIVQDADILHILASS